MSTHRGSDILERIVQRRRERLRGTGPGDGPRQGLALSGPGESPPHRPFPRSVICEIKRRSPSRGALAPSMDPVEQARRYREGGARAVSILTEQDHFRGSLADLVAVRSAFPDLAILRKDFLLNREDLEVSRDAGADAVLLIAGVLRQETLGRLMDDALSLGLTALVEVHTRAELEMVRPLKPELIGINARDLRTFRVDLLHPLALATHIDWGATTVFESGIFHVEDALTARDGGFSALLVGEAVMRFPERVREFAAVMEGGGEPRAGSQVAPFWTHCARGPRPLVKICGITNRADALLAANLGADLLGLVYAPSRRSAPAGLARELKEIIPVPLVGVVLEPGPDAATPGDTRSAREEYRRARRDLDAGYLSALQLHGDAPVDQVSEHGWPAYKAIRPATAGEAETMIREFRGARILVDAYHPRLAGGTGQAVQEEILETVARALKGRPQGELWLAGGLGPATVAAAVERWKPELVDASSALEAEPGRKDPELMKAFFTALGPRHKLEKE